MNKVLFPMLALVLALVLALLMMILALAGSGPSIWTDKQDYAPGEVVTISGSGFLANTPVTVTVERPDDTKDTISPAPVTDDAGNFNCTYQLDGIAGIYTVTATDGTNTATTTFTDLPKVVSVSVAPASRSVNQGTPATYTVTVTRGPGADRFDAELSIINAFPSIPGTSITFTPQPISFPVHQPYISLTSTLTITTDSLSPTMYTFNVKAERTIDNDYAISSQVTLTIIDTTPPVVSSIVRANPSPTNATSVDFTVTFSESVTGVDTTDFTLTTTGAITGASVSSVSGSGSSYTVTVNTGTGDGTIRLDVTDDDSIADSAGNKLGGMGTGNGDFTSGEVYTIDKTPPTVTLTPYTPDPTNDNTPSYSGIATDATSNVVDIEFRVEGGSWTDVDAFTPALSVGFTFTTSTLADGPHTIEVRAQDAAGNWSSFASDTLTVDTTPPVGSITINGGAAYTNTVSVTLNLATTDAMGVTGYRMADGTDASGASTVVVSSTTSFSADIPWTLPSGDGTKTVTVQYRDAAGNWSINHTDSIILDTSPPNSPPVLASIGDKTVNELTALTFTVSATDAEAPPQVLSYSIESGSQTGMNLNSSTGAFSWTPSEEQGPGSYDVTFGVTDDGTPNLYDEETITITVNEVNQAPVANDDSYATDEGNSVNIGVLSNDTDVDGDTLSVESVTTPTHGTATIEADNTITYNPEADYNGSNSFTYTVSDGNGGTDTATVSVTINPVNDTPTADDQAASLNEDTTTSITLTGSDVETASVNLIFKTTTLPANGQLYDGTGIDGHLIAVGELPYTVADATHKVTYQPNANYNGVDSFQFKVRDTGDGLSPALESSEATVTITVNPARRSVGGGGGAGRREYFTVDFLAEITKEPISSTGRLLDSLVAPSPDGIHALEIEKDTMILSKDGEVIKLIKITEAETPHLPENTVVVGKIYDFEPSNITFSKPVRLTLGYNINELPENVISVALAYYTTESGWVELEAEDGEVAELGRLTTSLDHFTLFAVLAKVSPPLSPPPPLPPPPAPAAPAAFELSNLSIMPSFSKVWELLTFVVKTGEEVTITVDVTNYGGQEGNYGALLKINGVTQAVKEITLGAGQCQKIVFTVTENKSGSYTVEIGNLSGEFQSLLWFNWWLIGGLTAAFILLGWLAWYYWYYKESGKTHQK